MKVIFVGFAIFVFLVVSFMLNLGAMAAWREANTKYDAATSGVQKSETPEGVQTRDMRVPNPPVTFEYVGETSKVQVYTFANHGRRCWVAQAASQLAPQVSITCTE